MEFQVNWKNSWSENPEMNNNIINDLCNPRFSLTSCSSRTWVDFSKKERHSIRLATDQFSWSSPSPNYREAIYKRTRSYNECFSLPSNEQFGILRRRSTIDALGKMTIRIRFAQTNSFSVDFVDIEKSHDTIDHIYLFQKLTILESKQS